MPAVVLDSPTDFAGWRTAARRLIAAGVPSEDVTWSVAGEAADLFGAAAEPAAAPAAGFTVPRRFVELAEHVICAREPQRFALLYALLRRLVGGERHLLDQPTDPQLHRAEVLAKAVRRDIHKMRAFVRFREVEQGAATAFVAWFEPAHYIVEANAPFFMRRFPNMAWSILTPDRSAHWDSETLRFAAGVRRSELPDGDSLEAYWRTYYASIFNPARLKIAAMQSEMPRKYWKNLPEAALIPEMVRRASERQAAMVEAGPTQPSRLTAAAVPATVAAIPPAEGLAGLAAAAAACRRCPLWEPATQTVFGEGPADAVLMLIGEQPGDQEDLAGRVFVGPAGQLLDKALAAAGLDRGRLYITNAVKHFKFVPRGKRRLHQKPGSTEIVACAPWLARERAIVRPRLTMLLGASAARTVLGRAVAVMRERGQVMALPDGGAAMLTVHPSYILRLREPGEQGWAYESFVADLRSAREMIFGNELNAPMGGLASQAGSM